MAPTGKVAWFKSDTGVVVDATGVNRWEDQSGLGNHATQSTDSLKPQLIGNAVNGRTSILFSSDQLNVPNMSSVAASEADIFIVASSSVSINDGVSNGPPFDAGTGNGGFNNLYPLNDGKVYFRNFWGSSLNFIPTLDVNVWRLSEISSRSGEHIRRIDTSDQISLGGGYSPPTVVRFGNISGGGTLYFSGSIAEVVFFFQSFGLF